MILNYRILYFSACRIVETRVAWERLKLIHYRHTKLFRFFAQSCHSLRTGQELVISHVIVGAFFKLGGALVFLGGALVIR